MFDDIQKIVKDLAASVKSVKKELSDNKVLIKKLEGRIDILSLLVKKGRKK